LQLWDGSSWVGVPAARQRTVLAVLLAEGGRSVSTDRLVEELWGGSPPRRATETVQVYVGRLRRLVGSAVIVAGRGSGYRLVVDDDGGGVDAGVFERLAVDARKAMAADRPETAVDLFTQALALWRGPALADVPTGPVVAALAARLDQARLGAVEDLIGVRLGLGQHAAVVDDLGWLVAQHPLRERLHAHYMLALYRCGRRADALAAYQDARRVVVEELGLEPGPELRGIEQAILADEQAATTSVGLDSPVPAQLPPASAYFTGRAAQFKQLDAMLDRLADGDPVLVVSAIAGSAGVGKTELAVHWGHRVRDRFPDGQLYVNLRGYAAAAPLRPIEALAGLLASLGVPARDVPVDQEQAVAMYRSLLAGKRMLVLLDNARRPDQVRPLLPGTAGCLVLVTSRDQMGGLVARDGAARLDLGMLSADEAQTLLALLLGPERLAAQPESAQELARLCGYLPLAIRIAAANLQAHPGRTMAGHVAALRNGDRLTALEVQGDPQAGVRTAFDQSYESLPAEAARLFRLLGLVPGPDIATEAAAALGASSVESAADLLDRLAAAHLVVEHGSGRYTLHDLLRLYATEQAAVEDGPVGSDAALARLYRYYLHAASAAADLLYPEMLRLPAPTAQPAQVFAGSDEASHWLDTERANLVAAVTTAAGHGQHKAAWRLADVLRGYLYICAHLVDWQTVAAAGLAAAQADGDPGAQAAAHLSVGMLHWVQGNPQEAVDILTAAHAEAGRARWREGEAVTLGNLGSIHSERGQLAQAAQYDSQALAIFQQVGWRPGQASKLCTLGIAQVLMGRLEPAVGHLTQAVALLQAAGSHSMAANALANLGVAYRKLGRLADARATLDQAIALTQQTGNRVVGPYARAALAAVERDRGRLTDARRLADAAVAQAGANGDPRVRAEALAVLASIVDHLGEHQTAIDLYRQAVEQASRTGPRSAELDALIGLATAQRHTGQLAEAALHATEALRIARRDGYRVHEADALTASAAIHLGQVELDEALAQLDLARSVNAETGNRLSQARSLLLSAHVLHRLGRHEHAHDHRHEAMALFAQAGASVDPHERALLQHREDRPDPAR
jgi:DNA-binding SARP family transcriptional activator/tetratricopeptide (TPR) repeat protein